MRMSQNNAEYLNYSWRQFCNGSAFAPVFINASKLLVSWICYSLRHIHILEQLYSNLRLQKTNNLKIQKAAYFQLLSR
ncbi:hypothetical protein LENED_006655 [Lentinula edodes]|uniref:Uncharacterized protein n=1 Tax=Lentinula edodes TaxID=5353 RepID=A0A1Q3ECA6_LENED|nr:hypothetical protein LENED_006655 [Lentinula edodes]